jgi:hypothetical protein
VKDAKERIVRSLRDIAPGHVTTRIWGRGSWATADEAQPGNAWAANLEDVADVILGALNTTERVKGYCPMGCGETLFLGDAGYVTCSWVDCPVPDAVSTILESGEKEHLVQLMEDGFTVRHPLRERLGDGLMKCTLTEHVRDLPPDRVVPGLWRLSRDAAPGGMWNWEEIR